MREVHNERCFASGGSGPPQELFPPERSVFYTSGRQALVALIHAIGASAGDAVVLPAFVPEGVFAPFQRAGMEIRLYPLDENLNPQWDRLEELMSAGRTRMAVLIHYFGMRMPVERFRALCERYGVFMIEDLAHVHAIADESIGITGDAILYSLPKIVGVPDGAALVLRANSLSPSLFEYVRDVRHVMYLAAQTAQLGLISLSRRVPANAGERFIRRAAARLSNSYRLLMMFFHRPTRMSALSRRLLACVPWEATVLHRRRLETLYDAELDPRAFKRFTRDTGVSHASMGFAVRAEDRAGLVAELRKHHIHGVYFEYKWDYFPSTPDHQIGIDVMKDHFLFPTAFSLTTEEIRRVIAVANAWAARVRVQRDSARGAA